MTENIADQPNETEKPSLVVQWMGAAGRACKRGAVVTGNIISNLTKRNKAISFKQGKDAKKLSEAAAQPEKDKPTASDFYPVAFGLAGVGVANYFGLPHGRAGLYAGWLTFAASAYVGSYVVQAIWPEPKDKVHIGRGLKATVLGFAVVTGISIFPEAVKSQVDKGGYSHNDIKTNGMISLARKDAHWLEENDIAAALGQMPDKSIAAMAGYFEKPVHLTTGKAGHVVELYNTPLDNADVIARVNNGSQLFCAAYAANDQSYGGKGMLKLKYKSEQGKDVSAFTPYSTQWKVSQDPADVQACEKVFGPVGTTFKARTAAALAKPAPSGG